MPSLAIVILNYNRADLLADCLESIYAAPMRCSLNVWVVDNASSDGSAEMVRTRFPQAQLIVSPINGGFSHGNNLALRQILTPAHATDYVLLLNNDTLVPAGALDGLVEYLEQHGTVGAVGPKLLLPDGSLDLACRRSFPTPEVALYRMLGLARLFPHSPRFARYNMTYLDPDQETEVDSLVGACMLIRHQVLREVGLLDEAFFMYGEDLDWAYRIKTYGWRIVYYPRVIVHHYKRAASTRRAIPSIRAFYDAMRIFHRKHYAATTPAALNALIELGITLKELLALGRNYLLPPAARRVG
ncbi:glycosyl transferase family 2 [Oscillochloris trichoides DG-6]|uniref:Glycosyl transferase family 2 n=1 Tax=Oscillochloris trichoides DG-6 TaxID=765420 RepID=E1IH44_9CHLR|nr:glycosyltransferase family 2 protein [Oscillochloris trichoides]EFO79519.1 glycosyl transferase family 2 [Oscillochloris trichoides DG-6]